MISAIRAMALETDASSRTGPIASKSTANFALKAGVHYTLRIRLEHVAEAVPFPAVSVVYVAAALLLLRSVCEMYSARRCECGTSRSYGASMR